MDVTQAEREIASILQRLEKENDCLVRSMTLETMEITQYRDDRRRFGRNVTITLERVPGNDYLQADKTASSSPT